MSSLKFMSCWTLQILVCNLVLLCDGYLIDNNPFRHIETLDPEGKYELQWIVDFSKSRVTFNVTVETKGYVGLGLSLKGKMSGADIVIGGVYPNGKPYLTDRHAIANQLPELDESQDWTLHTAWESSTHTFLSFSRPFETCDEDHDLPITDDFLTLIWAYGEKDNEIEYHYQNRGRFDVYLLDPDLTPRAIQPAYRSNNPKALGDLQVWTIQKTQLIPAKPTAYICSIHKAPSHRSKQHIIGFDSILPTDLERRHIHHFLLHRCYPPQGQDAATVFQRHVGRPGEECYILDSTEYSYPTNLCRDTIHVWDVGGRAVFFPDHVGIALSESPNEYYMLQVHYDNPEELPGIELNFSLEGFYTSKVRKHDAGVIGIGEVIPGSPSIMLPPSSLEHVIYGHCGSGCTRKMIPPTGIRAFAANLHTHLAGRGIRILQIRDNEELPWISADDNYNFNFQQVRIFRNERLILPGDLLINRCVYETTDRNGSVVVGGFGTKDEMCNGFMWYYNKISGHHSCRSDIRSDIYRNFMTIRNTTWDESQLENVVTSPRQNAGLTVTQVGNERMDWTIDKRNQLQKYHRYLPQITGCSRLFPNESPVFTQPPPLQRYSYSFKGGISNSVSGSLTSSLQNEILDPEYEFVTIYPKDIVPYERPQLCRGKKKLRSLKS